MSMHELPHELPMEEHKGTGKVCPRDFFSVPEHVKYLEPQQLLAFEEAFAHWRDAARRMDSVRARQRMWILFLLLRHSGARLGEVLALDDTVAFDARGSLVRIGQGGKTREVPLPEHVFREIFQALEGAAGAGRRGEFFHVDPGYFRRICYARGRECGLPRELAGPNVLRNTRAVEMLRNGVPITVVKEVLGQSSLQLTAAFQQFSRGDISSILQKSWRRKTSARNAFVGHVTEVKSDAIMAEVVVETRSGDRVCSIITVDSLHSLNIEPGAPVAATVKAPLVNVVPCAGAESGNGPATGSPRNRFRATVLRVTGSPVLTEVLGRLPDGTDMCALISTGSMDELGLEPGMEAEFWFKALSVVLNTV